MSRYPCTDDLWDKPLHKPGPQKPLAAVHSVVEALDMAEARAVYHAERHPQLWSTGHILDWIQRARELYLAEHV